MNFPSAAEATGPADVATRRWRLTGYGADKKVVHSSTPVGDKGLDEAMRILENRKDVERITAALA